MLLAMVLANICVLPVMSVPVSYHMTWYHISFKTKHAIPSYPIPTHVTSHHITSYQITSHHIRWQHVFHFALGEISWSFRALLTHRLIREGGREGQGRVWGGREFKEGGRGRDEKRGSEGKGANIKDTRCREVRNRNILRVKSYWENMRMQVNDDEYSSYTWKNAVIGSDPPVSSSSQAQCTGQATPFLRASRDVLQEKRIRLGKPKTTFCAWANHCTLGMIRGVDKGGDKGCW